MPIFFRSCCCACAAGGQAATAMPNNDMKSRRLIAAPEAKDKASYQSAPERWKGVPNVRFVPKADICAAKSDVRFAPNSDRESGFPAKGHVRFTPESGRVRRKPLCLLWANSGHRSFGGRDVLIHTEQVCRIIALLDFSQAVVALPIRRANPIRTFVHHEIYVSTSC